MYLYCLPIYPLILVIVLFNDFICLKSHEMIVNTYFTFLFFEFHDSLYFVFLYNFNIENLHVPNFFFYTLIPTITRLSTLFFFIIRTLVSYFNIGNLHLPNFIFYTFITTLLFFQHRNSHP